MSSAEWATFGLEVLKFVVGVGLSLLYVVLMLLLLRHVWSHFTEGGSPAPSLRVLARRIWCRHPHLTNIHGGRRLTYGVRHVGGRRRVCTACGVNVDRGRPTEFRR